MFRDSKRAFTIIGIFRAAKPRMQSNNYINKRKVVCPEKRPATYGRVPLDKTNFKFSIFQ